MAAAGAFDGPEPSGRRGTIAHSMPLPVEGSAEVAMPVERLWSIFLDVRRWPEWNPCFWRSGVKGGEMRVGASLRFAFNPIEGRYLYKLPGSAEIVELVPHDRVTWEVTAPGFHALHSYRFAAVGSERCRFGSWEVAEGPTYRALERFWLAHFRYVCRESLAGARGLGA
ncbi:MAG TPA: SRPBCC family protein [Thermoleophilaceae bacterium]|nr:SRPBCC family protein [Thermoleophilaceae bacterium]